MKRAILLTVLLVLNGFAITGCEQEKKNRKSESVRSQKICSSDCFGRRGQQ